MLLLVNAAVFQVAWLSSVMGAASNMPWLGPLSVLVAIGIHLYFARRAFEEVVLLLICALIGVVFDSLLVSAGWVTYESGLFSAYFAPYWIVTMWMLFATTLNVSMRFLRGKPKMAAAFGFYGGPTSYLAGQALGGIVLTNQIAALLALAIGWAIFMPALMWLSEHLDGMPGARRVWIAERSR